MLAVVDALRSQGMSISHNQILHGLSRVVTNTHLKGRWQLLSRRPTIVCDTGHNLDGIREVVRQLRAQSYRRLHMVIGMVKDKDVQSILEELPRDASYYFCQASIPRALPAEDLRAAAEKAGLRGTTIADVNEAIHAAQQAADENDFIFVGGSTFVVAEIENL